LTRFFKKIVAEEEPAGIRILFRTGVNPDQVKLPGGATVFFEPDGGIDGNAVAYFPAKAIGQYFSRNGAAAGG